MNKEENENVVYVDFVKIQEEDSTEEEEYKWDKSDGAMAQWKMLEQRNKANILSTFQLIVLVFIFFSTAMILLSMWS